MCLLYYINNWFITNPLRKYPHFTVGVLTCTVQYPGILFHFISSEIQPFPGWISGKKKLLNFRPLNYCVVSFCQKLFLILHFGTMKYDMHIVALGYSPFLALLFPEVKKSLSAAFALWPPITDKTNPLLRDVQSLTHCCHFIKQIIDKGQLFSKQKRGSCTRAGGAKEIHCPPRNPTRPS